MAGGRGERLGALTRDLPKPMIPVLGKPLLEHQLLWLKSFGFSRVTFCLGYKAEAVRAHFGDGARFGARIDYRIEKEARGTAGCVRDLALPGDALVVYGDLFPDLDLGRFLDFHQADPSAAATICVWESDHPLDSDLARMDGDRITGFFRAQPGQRFENVALAAVWAVRPSLMPLIFEDRPSDFGRDVFPEAARRGLVLRGYRTQETLADLGTPERLEAFLKARRA